MIEGFFSVLRDYNVVSLVAQDRAQAFGDRQFIVSDENLRLIHSCFWDSVSLVLGNLNITAPTCFSAAKPAAAPSASRRGSNWSATTLSTSNLIAETWSSLVHCIRPFESTEATINE